MLPNVLNHSLAGGIAGFVHREDQSVEYQLLVHFYDALNPTEDLRRGLESQWLALQRHDHVLAAK